MSDSKANASDSITDFEQGKDKLLFRDEFRAAADLHFIGDAAFSGTPGEVRFAVFQGSSLFAVYLDIDGNGEADSVIVFGGEIPFQASDFSF